MYVCLFIPDPVGPMIQHHVQEKYMQSPQVAHCGTVLRGTSSKSVSMQASQISSQEVRTRSMFEVRRLNMNTPHSDATTTRQTATHGTRQTITPDNVQMTLPANQSESNIASRARTHTCYAICSSNVQLSEALGRTCLPVAHGPTVYAHQSVTLVHPASSPVSAKLLERVALSCFGVCSRIASNVYAHSTCNLVVFTA